MAQKQTIGSKIKDALNETATSQVELAKRLGITPGVITRWTKGDKIPTIENLQRIAEALELPLEYFISSKRRNSEGRVKMNTSEVTYIPILGTSSATKEKFILEEKEGFIPLAQANSTQFAVKVEGDCMVDPKDHENSIYDGSYIIVDPEAEVSNGDVVLARISEEYSTIKRIFIKSDCIKLIPDNPKCKTLIRKKEDIEVIGKVVHVYKPVKRKKERE